jgi:hypothetical protein
VSNLLEHVGIGLLRSIALALIRRKYIGSLGGIGMFKKDGPQSIVVETGPSEDEAMALQIGITEDL